MNASFPFSHDRLRSVAVKLSICAVVCASVCLAQWSRAAVFADPTRAANNDGGALSSVAGDLNNDGRAEFVSIASKHSSQPHFRIYAYDPATQGFTTHNVMSQAAVGNRRDRFGGDLAVGDMNNDGFKDIIVPDSDNSGGAGQMSWFQNPGGNLGGVWTEQVITTWNGGTGENVEHLAELAVADVDGNGWLDVVSRDVSHGSWLMLRNSNGTGWQTRRFIAMNPREGLELWDMDQDGDLDILLNGIWLETPANPLSGTFVPHTISAAWYPSSITNGTISNFASKVDFGDFNGDSRVDVVITNGEELAYDSSTASKPKGVRLFLSPANPASGTWTEVMLDPNHFSWQSLQIGDIDRDGDLDIVTGISQVGVDNAAPDIVAFLNDGTGTNFARQTIDIGQDNFGQVVFVYNSSLGDADGDGDLDLLAPHDWNNGPLRYYQNISSPATTLPPTAPASLTASLGSVSRIDLAWSDQSNTESGFKIERSINSAAFVQIAQTGAGVTAFADPGLSPNTQYGYRVRAFNVSGDSAFSAVASATTPGDTTPPVFTSVASAPNATVIAIFSEPVEPASAQNVSNYSLDGGVVVNSATLAGDGLTVTLATTSLIEGGSYTLTATGVRDLSVARNPSNTAATFVHASWVSQNIGSVAATGSMVIAGPAITVAGSGADIYGTADGFRFAYLTFSGDVEIVARVVSQTRTSPYAKAGVMIRETLTSGSKHALMALTPDFGGEMNFRATVGGTTGKAEYNPAVTPPVGAPYWVKMVRQGAVLTGSVSSDGVQWQQVGTATVSMSAVAYVGLAVTSHSDGLLSTARFENVSVQGPATTQPPLAPTSLSTVAASSTRIDLAWLDQSSNETGFKIERSVNSSAFVQIAQTAAGVTTFADPGLAAETQYTYRVRAFNAAADSAYSLESSATTLVAPQPPPAAPAGLTANPVTSSRVDLAWSDQSTNESGFRIERKIGTAGFIEIAQTGAGVTAFSDSGLAPSTSYIYRVRAFNTSGDSAYTSESAATTPAAPQPLGVPANLVASLISISRIDLTWTDQSTNETGFKIERSINSAAFVEFEQTAAGVTAVTDSGLTGGMHYSYRVRAFNATADSAYSLEASATTPSDTTAPVFTSVSSAPDATVTAVFSEPVTVASAENVANWSLGGGAVVNSGQLAADGLTVTLATTGLVEGNTYSLAATGVRDLSVVPNASNTVATFEHAAWSSQDIGSVAATGSMVISGPAMIVAGSGADIYGAADEFHFAYRAVSGDVSIVARIVSQTKANPYSKSGVMIRETLGSGSKHAYMALTADFGGEMNFRTTTGGTTGKAAYNPAVTPPVDAPYWVRIVRQGALLTGSVSVDGLQWQQAGTATVSMAAEVFVGLAVTSHNDGALSTARFENVGIKATPAPAIVTLGSLTHTFDGTPKPVSATTSPAGLFVSVTYDGSTTPPSNAGSYQVSGTVNELNFQGVVTGSLVIAPGNDIVTWRNVHFTGVEQTTGLAAGNADPDSDGWPNLAEFALGSDPREFTAPLALALDQNGLSLTFTRPAGLQGVSYGAESSGDLVNWTPVSLELLSTGTTETLRARAPLATGDPSRGFLRLRFEGP